MADIDLVVTDLDGTLWGADERVHADTLAAIAQLRRRGTEVLVATGRRPRSAAAVLERERLSPPAVTLNGALGIDLATWEVFHRHGYDPADAAVVLEAFRAEGLEPVVYVEEGDTEVLAGARCSTHPQHLDRLGSSVRRADLDAAVVEHPVLAFAVIGGEPARLRRVADRIDGPAAASVTRDLLYGGATLMVPPPGIDKWEGVVAWCERRGFDPGRVLAVGDGTNDLELLRRAAVACAITDGSAEALAVADHVLEPPSAGGWSAILGLVGRAEP